MAPDVARREAVLNAFRAELVGATVAGIAYGSLIVTRFRGFNQFGVIGFVGMLLVWASIVPLVPALIVMIERGERLCRTLSTSSGGAVPGRSGAWSRAPSPTSRRAIRGRSVAAAAVLLVAAGMVVPDLPE